MGELLDQVLAGGPGLLPLTPCQQRVADCLARDPSGWAWDIRRLLDDGTLREVVRGAVVGTGHPPHDVGAAYLEYDRLLTCCAQCAADESWARTLIAWMCPELPQFRLGAPGWHEAFRAAVLRAAAFRREHEALQRSVRRPDAPPWEDGAALVLAALCEEAP